MSRLGRSFPIRPRFAHAKRAPAVSGAAALSGAGSLGVGGGASYSAAILATSGLYAYYRLGEASGSTLVDSKSALNATVVGGPIGYAQPGAINGDSNGSVLLDTRSGGSDYISAPFSVYDFWAANVGSFSMECWFYRPSDVSPVDKNDECIIGGFSGPGGAMIWTDFFNSGKYGVAHSGDSFGYYLQCDVGPTLGAFDHLVLVYDITVGSQGTAYLYVNNVLKSTRALSEIGAAAPSDVWHDAPIEIGSYEGGTGGKLYGRVDEAAFYSVALTPTQIGNHYTIGTTGGGGVPPVVTKIGVAALAGAGSATIVGRSTRRAAAALTGSGTLAATGSRRVVGAATLSGTGALSATGGLVKLGAAVLAGAGALAATGTRVKLGAAALMGVGSLAASGTRGRLGAAALSGAGTLASSGTIRRLGSAALTGTGALTSAGVRRTFGLVALAGSGSIAAAGFKTKLGAATLAGSGAAVVSNRTRITFSAAALSGHGLLEAEALGVGVKIGRADLVGTSTLAATGTRATFSVATLSGTGLATSSGRVTRYAQIALSGSSTLTAAGVRKVLAATQLVGTGTLGAAGNLRVSGVAALYGFGLLLANAEEPVSSMPAPLLDYTFVGEIADDDGGGLVRGSTGTLSRL